MLLRINPENPEMRKIKQAVKILENGGIIIYPTDTVYGLGCDIFNQKAIERILQLKGIKPKKANLSFICNDLSHISEYTRPFDNATFRILKKALPGPYTFILSANNNVPKLFKNTKKTVGIRVPDNQIAQLLVQELGRPILSTSLKVEDDIQEYPTDPELIHDDYKKLVDVVIDGGYGNLEVSTVVDVTGYEPEIIREGAGEVIW
jgi:tRNA threonylcarbamoyl adenosine modification protein (Sua5/YciO/YrdC/YwlC family)